MANAAVMYGFNEPLKIESIELKEPRHHEVVVQLTASGVCHSDLSAMQGKIPFPPPVVLGHEGAGVVEEVGPGVTTLKPGDHVVLSWVVGCGSCPYCVAGREHLCDAGLKATMAQEEAVFHKNGTDISRFIGVASFSERTIVRESAAIKIRDDMPLDKACLVGCGVMTGVGAAVNTVRIEPGQTVAVFGCGGVGLNVIQGASLQSPSKIIAVDLVDSKLDLARRFGATDTVNPGKDGNVVEALKSLTGGLGVDYAFEVIGAPPVVTDAFKSAKRGGAVVVVGVPAFGQDVSLPGFSIPMEEKRVLGSLYGSGRYHRDMPRLIDLYMQKRLKIDELISRTIRLDEVNAAFEAIEKGEVARSVIVYD